MYAAGGAYFLVLALVPGLELAAMLPGEAGEAMEELIRRWFPWVTGLLPHTPGRGPVLGIVAVWSASRGLYGLVLGLKAVYRRNIPGRWLGRRLLCMGYALGALAAGTVVLPLVRQVIPGGILTALAAQTGVFWALYLTVSGEKKRAAAALAGAAAGVILCSVVTWGLGFLAGLGGGFGMPGVLLTAYLWARGVVLGAVLHGKLAQIRE